MSAGGEGYVLLEDGTRFDGELCAADGHAVGEVVFTTGMSGQVVTGGYSGYSVD